MQNKTILTIVGAALCFVHASFGATNTNVTKISSSIDLNYTKGLWWGAFFVTPLTVSGTTQSEPPGSEVVTSNTITGNAELKKLTTKLIMQSATNPPKGGKLYAVWFGPGPSTNYPYLSAWKFTKIKAGEDLPPAPINNLPGWQIQTLYIQDPYNTDNVLTGSLKTIVSGGTNIGNTSGNTWLNGGLVVPDTAASVPKEQQKITGYTKYSFGLLGDKAPAKDQATGWGKFIADFKKLFSSGGKIRISGLSEVSAQ